MCLLTGAASSPLAAQLIPNPNSVSAFAPEGRNGPVAGAGGIFMVGACERAGTPPAVTLWAFDGNTGQAIPFPASFGTPQAVPFTVAPVPTGGADSPLSGLFLHNGLGPPGVDPAEDDNPQGIGGSGMGTGGRTMHQRRHHLAPVNQELVQWLVDDPEAGSRLMISTVVKPAVAPALVEGGVLTVDYGGYPATLAPPVATSVWPSAVGAAAPGGAGANSTVYAYPGLPPLAVLPQVLSDLAPNVVAQSGGFNRLAWVAGNQTAGDYSGPAFGAVEAALLIADYSSPGVPAVTGVELESPFSPYATRILVWTDVDGAVPLAQYVLVPCRDGVEIYDPLPSGTPPVAPALVKVVPAGDGKEICSNIACFGPTSLDPANAQTPYFIVLQRDRGETQGANGGVNFLVFDLLPSSSPASYPYPDPSVDPYARLGSAFQGTDPLDMLRGFNDIAIAPPERDIDGGWNSSANPNATAWFGVWDANSSLAGTGLFGAMVGVENHGLSPYWDGGAGFNAAFSGSYPNVRYFTPVMDAQGTTLDPYPVPVGEVSTNPIFNPFPSGGLVNQNLVSWYFDNGEEDGYGVAVLDVLATWGPAANQALPGGALVDGTAGGAYPGAPARSQETVTERPLFGYMNYPVASIVFAQRQIGIETFAGWLNAAQAPLNRPRYGLATFSPLANPPQTPPPANVPWSYQKRRHAVFNPSPVDHPNISGSGYTQFDDLCMTVQASEAWSPPVFWPLMDDPITYFVNWRNDPVFSISPWPQGVNYYDWHSTLSAGGLNNPLAPWFGYHPLLAERYGTTSPPPNALPSQATNFGGPHYFVGQTPLWVDWLTTFTSAFTVPFAETNVLRTHANPYPLAGNDAWVGLGANMWIRFSAVATYGLADPWLGVQGQASIAGAHVDQADDPGAPAGLPPTQGGPGGYRISFLHFQADPTQTNLAPAGPGYEMTCVNSPNQNLVVPQPPLGTQYDWQFVFPPTQVVCTEILPVAIR